MRDPYKISIYLKFGITFGINYSKFYNELTINLGILEIHYAFDKNAHGINWR